MLALAGWPTSRDQENIWSMVRTIELGHAIMIESENTQIIRDHTERGLLFAATNPTRTLRGTSFPGSPLRLSRCFGGYRLWTWPRWWDGEMERGPR
jgi:hypothetical protein